MRQMSITGYAMAGAAAAAMALAGCASTGTQGALAAGGAAPAAAEMRSAAQVEADRQAILAMVGEYDVTFDFTETVPIAAGYDLAEDKVTPAREVVYVIADEPGFISLQHLLLVGERSDPMVIKHWRQDWAYEPSRLMAYRGFNRWDMTDVDPGQAAGAWSQTVYQVDDSPRYAGIARWEHADGASTWDPAVSWRPLPRRDATTRDDYDVIAAVNRHTVLEWGWTHEQDNSKLVLRDGAERELVREHGINTYRRASLEGAGNAERYWAATEGYWAMVRDAWDGIMAAPAFTVEDDAEGTMLYGPVLNEGQAVFMGGKDVDAAFADALAIIERQVETVR
ncbi:hypothetical protein FKB34_12480 [Glycocaulis profundi]|nr:hypothetical protein FKB34_12480 [Glycocaulis profundi]